MKRSVVFALLLLSPVFCLAGVLQQTLQGNAIEVQQVAIVTVTVYQPEYMTVQVPVYVPVTAPTTVTTTTVQSTTFVSFLTFVLVHAPNALPNLNATWTTTYTFTNGTIISYSETLTSTYSEARTQFSNQTTLTFTQTFVGTSHSSYTTTSTYTNRPFIQIQTLMTYVTLAPQWLPQPTWGYELLSVGAVGAVAGYLLKGSLAKVRAKPTRAPTQSQTQSTDLIYCHKCGVQSRSGNLFCAKCGTKLG